VTNFEISVELFGDVFILFKRKPINKSVPVIINEYPVIVPVKPDDEVDPTVHKTIIIPVTINEL
jgi:hypothetical protein